MVLPNETLQRPTFHSVGIISQITFYQWRLVFCLWWWINHQSTGCPYGTTTPKKNERNPFHFSSLCAPAAWKNLGEAISNLLVCPNECVSPQGSVEAQCGLVLNGQGGVIRRGKALFIVCCCTGGSEHSRHDTTRQRSRQTNRRNTPLLSAVNTFEQERPRFLACLSANTLYTRMRRRVPFPVLNGLSLNTYVFFFFTSRSKHFLWVFFFSRKLKCQQSHD